MLHSMLYYDVNTHCRRPCVRVGINLGVAVKCVWVSVMSAETNADRCIPPIPREHYNMARPRPPYSSPLPRPPRMKPRFRVPTSMDTSSRFQWIWENISATCSLDSSRDITKRLLYQTRFQEDHLLTWIILSIHSINNQDIMVNVIVVNF